MPPSIPSSLNFAADGAPRGGGLLRWPKSVLGFLQGYLRRGAAGGTTGQTENNQREEHANATTSSKATRKISRVDVDTPGEPGVVLSFVDVGLSFGGGEEEDPRQTIINATEQVIASVRQFLIQDPEKAPPRILLLGRNAEVRAQYLSHSCNFGVESGNTPADCVWSLVDSEGQVVVREYEEGVHWSEDVTDVHQLVDGSFDVIVLFSVQFNPNDMSDASSLTPTKHLTQRWWSKLAAVVADGGCIAGLACLERGPSSNTTTNPTSAFTPISNLGPSPSIATRASTGSTATAVASVVPAQSSKPSAPCPFAPVRAWRDCTESLGFFVHLAMDLEMEGRPVLLEVEEEDLFPNIQRDSKEITVARFMATKKQAVSTQDATSLASTISPAVRRTSSLNSFGTLHRSSSTGSLGPIPIPVGGSRSNSRPIHLSVVTGSPPSESAAAQLLSSGANFSPALSTFTNLSIATSASSASSSIGVVRPFHSHHRSTSSASPALPNHTPSPTLIGDLSMLPPTAASHYGGGAGGYSASSSPSPSPKLSPSAASGASGDLNMFALNQLAAMQQHRRLNDTSPHSAASSSRSSPSLAPATPSSVAGWAGVLHEPIVISGVSIGLPNALTPAEEIFSKFNVDKLFDGVNLIAPLSADDKASIVDMNSCQVSKDKVTGARVKTYLKDDPQLIQVSAKFAPRDSWGLAKAYGLPSHVMEVLDPVYELAVCAGLEALKDAGFNDLKLSASTPAEIGLPEHMRDETGVIFASSFPSLDSIVTEVTAKVRNQTMRELTEQLGLPRPTDKEYEYEYDRKLLFKLLVMANCQLAELIKARGPNIHINTACSGTTQAIATAEAWMKTGICKRVIVIAADVATNSTIFKYLGTGFLALGAASILPGPTNAAAPFDARRKGMILGAGATGLVLEYATSCLARGVTPKVELVGAHQGNSAFHATLMDSISISQQLNMFLKKVENEKGLSITTSGSDFTKDLIYFSHETSTSANGGCAKVEMEALASIWSDESGQQAARHEILITNTKGLTGHPMGVGFEDVMAVESLHRGRVPPVANFQKLDPRLEPFITSEQISKGGTHSRNYVLRMAGGFGNQFAYVLYRKWNEANTASWTTRLQYQKYTQANAFQRLPGYYTYPLQISSHPNSTFVSRVNSSSNLIGMVQ